MVSAKSKSIAARWLILRDLGRGCCWPSIGIGAGNKVLDQSRKPFYSLVRRRPAPNTLLERAGPSRREWPRRASGADP